MKTLKKSILSTFLAILLAGLSLCAQNKTSAIRQVDSTLSNAVKPDIAISIQHIKNALNRVISFADSLKNRNSHVGIQSVNSISGLQPILDGKQDIATLGPTVRAHLNAGTGIDYNSTTGTIGINQSALNVNNDARYLSNRGGDLGSSASYIGIPAQISEVDAPSSGIRFSTNTSGLPQFVRADGSRLNLNVSNITGTKTLVFPNASATLATLNDTVPLLPKVTAAALYVPRVAGKQLSTNDFTTEAKTVVDVIRAGSVYMEQFGGVGDGTTSNVTAMNSLISFLTTNGGGTVRLLKGSYNLNGQVFTLPVNVTLDFQGGVFKNGAIICTETTITGNLQQPVADMVIRGSCKKSNTVYNYATMTEMKNFVHWPNKLCRTNGFHYENDGGGGEYVVNINSVFAAENQYFQPYWIDTNIAGGAGAYVKLSGQLSAKFISDVNEVNLAVFGVKYDADYFNPADKKYYADAAYTTLATDNYAALNGAIKQVKWWSAGMMSKNFVATKTVIINSTINLTHGGHEFALRGNGYADGVTISSNVALDALIENYYSAGAQVNNLTGTFYVISDITFKGHGRIANGLIVKNGYETDGIYRVQLHDFTNAGIVFYGVSSTFKVETISCFRNKYGVLITSTHPFRTTSNTNTMDGLVSLYKVSGDFNTKALIAINCPLSQGASVNIQSVKSENNDYATVLIEASTPQQHISVRNAFTNGDGDFLKIENYAGELPTIELEGIYHNDPDSDNWDIDDLKNAKQLRLRKNPTAAFAHIIYTNNVRNYQNGFQVYRNGVASNLSPFANFGTTANRPTTTNLEVGFSYFDTDLNTVVIWGGTSWMPFGGKIVDTTATPYTKATINATYPNARFGDTVIQDAAGKVYIKTDNSPTGNWSSYASAQLN